MAQGQKLGGTMTKRGGTEILNTPLPELPPDRKRMLLIGRKREGGELGGKVQIGDKVIDVTLNSREGKV